MTAASFPIMFSSTDTVSQSAKRRLLKVLKKHNKQFNTVQSGNESMINQSVNQQMNQSLKSATSQPTNQSLFESGHLGARFIDEKNMKQEAHKHIHTQNSN